MIKKELSLDHLFFSKEAFSLRDFSMTVYHSDIYGIICDHIEERDLILSLFEGKCKISSGSISLQNQEIGAAHFKQVLSSQLSCISKKSSLLHNMSISENICVFNSKRRWINYSKFEDFCRELLCIYGLALDVHKKVNDLTEKERITIELLRAVFMKKQIVILTGLSSILNLSDSAEIMSLIQKINSQEQITFIIIDIIGDLLFQWTNRILVMRHGITLGCFRTEYLNQHKLDHLFIDKEQKDRKEHDQYQEEFQHIFAFDNISTKTLDHLSFSVYSGEILNIYSMNQTTIEEIRDLIFGKVHVSSGQILFKNKPVTLNRPSDMHRIGIAYCRERAYRTMLIPDMSVRENILLELSAKMPPLDFSSKYKNSVDSQIRYWMKEDLCEKPVRELSLLQRQNLVYLKQYLEYPKVLIVESPLSDIDLHIKIATKNWIKAFQSRGTAIIILTNHTQDLYEFEGDIQYLIDGKTVDEDDVYQALYNKAEEQVF